MAQPFKQLLLVTGLLSQGCLGSAYTITVRSTDGPSSQATQRFDDVGERGPARLVSSQRPPRNPTCRPTTTSIKTKISSRRVSYDLGLGKNSPLINPSYSHTSVSPRTPVRPVPEHSVTPTPKKQQQQQQRSSSATAVAFLVEHEAVQDYPSPSTVTTQEVDKQNMVVQKQRQTPLVHPEAKRESPSSSKQNLVQGTTTRRANNGVAGNNIVMRGIAQTSKRQFELDTPWVEMLIHEQRSKLATAAAAVGKVR